MKLRFALFTSLLLFARGCDFYSTSLWFFQENGMADETNPLTQFFGVGWNGLIIANVIVVSLILVAYYAYCFWYSPKRELKATPKNFKEYASLLYFETPHRFMHIMYKMPKSWKPYLAHIGYVLVRVLIIASFLATFHNINQFYGFSFYAQFREIVRRPRFVIYGLIGLSTVLIYVRLLKSEFNQYLALKRE